MTYLPLSKDAHMRMENILRYIFLGGEIHIFFFHVLWNTLENFRENAFKSLFLVKD